MGRIAGDLFVLLGMVNVVWPSDGVHSQLLGIGTMLIGVSILVNAKKG